MTFDEALGRLRQGIKERSIDDQILQALANQVEANRKAIEELRADFSALNSRTFHVQDFHG